MGGGRGERRPDATDAGDAQHPDGNKTSVNAPRSAASRRPASEQKYTSRRGPLFRLLFPPLVTAPPPTYFYWIFYLVFIEGYRVLSRSSFYSRKTSWLRPEKLCCASDWVFFWLPSFDRECVCVVDVQFAADYAQKWIAKCLEERAAGYHSVRSVKTPKSPAAPSFVKPSSKVNFGFFQLIFYSVSFYLSFRSAFFFKKATAKESK